MVPGARVPWPLVLFSNSIETTAYREMGQTRTVWLVKVGGQIVNMGEVLSDPSGIKAHQAATMWAAENAPGVSFVWKHAVGSGP